MSRFLEEQYASRSYKAFIRRKGRSGSDLEGDAAARRAQYFSQPLSVRKAIHKASQARLDGFE